MVCNSDVSSDHHPGIEIGHEVTSNADVGPSSSGGSVRNACDDSVTSLDRGYKRRDDNKFALKDGRTSLDATVNPEVQ